MNLKYIIATSLLLISVTHPGCKKFVEPGLPKSSVGAEFIFNSDATAVSAITGLYATLLGTSTGRFINYRITLITGLMADEFIAPGGEDKAYYQNAVLPSNTELNNLWEDAYSTIYQSNAIIKGLESTTKVSTPVKTQLSGEAKFIRALSHFYLLHLFGDIPYIKTTDYVLNAQVKRMPASEVYPLIIEDLVEARSALSENYNSDERVRPNKWTAAALLARVYLYQKDWVNAEKLSSEIIQQSSLYRLADLDQVFKKASTETIWQLKPSSPGYNTWDGLNLILTATPTTVYLSPDFAQSFEKGDLRKSAWVDSLIIAADKWHYAAKYKIKATEDLTEYSICFRLAEQYLIRAEAHAHQNHINLAIDDLDLLRKRAGLPLLKDTHPDIQVPALLLAIEKERKSELFAEMGHRWFDLKRYEHANTVLSAIKGANWKPEAQLLPIPKAQMDRDNQMIQNPGYN